MRPRIALFGALGTLATVLAAVVVFAPDAVARVGPAAGLAAALEAVDRRQLLLLASVVVGLVVSVVSWRATSPTGDAADAFDEATAGPPEDVTTARREETAADLEAAVDAGIDGDEEATGRVRDRLRDAAVRTYSLSTGEGPDAARATVRTGEWTDDRTAAATVAGEDGPTYSLWSRLRLWLDPESERTRRFERTVRAIRRLSRGER